MVTIANIRAKVFERDHGICDSCKAHTLFVRSRLDRLLLEGLPVGLISELLKRQDMPLPLLKIKGWPLWEMDYIIPVRRGGAQYSLDNIRTLCVWCHEEKTVSVYFQYQL